jgi:hypothetical protein
MDDYLLYICSSIDQGSLTWYNIATINGLSVDRIFPMKGGINMSNRLLIVAVLLAVMFLCSGCGVLAATLTTPAVSTGMTNISPPTVDLTAANYASPPTLALSASANDYFCKDGTALVTNPDATYKLGRGCVIVACVNNGDFKLTTAHGAGNQVTRHVEATARTTAPDIVGFGATRADNGDLIATSNSYDYATSTPATLTMRQVETAAKSSVYDISTSMTGIGERAGGLKSAKIENDADVVASLELIRAPRS